MKITINRRYTGKTCVIGKFKVLDDDDKILFECFSLEEDKEGLESGKDLRIPEGNYNLKRHSPSRFENTLRSITKKDDDTMINVYNDDVPSSRAILIHWGNTDKDTQGCILLGLTKDNNNESVGQSRQACKEFYDLMHGKNLEDIKLEITNELA
ncbi:hypothetical protein RIC60_000131 [Campylobacter jejuni]|uniref:Uncharacterized protein n=9 Tax=Campylobacter TaxID=194 RepID=A0A6C7ZU09_CAMCO|nr:MULTISPECIES: DUF5675 family protein [Campylobacter]AHN82886.1 hypothetical protein 00-1597_00027 [Campylobacter phage CJIE4-2]AHN82943.1 hypothetical protein 00-2425_00026 [Campylobacter phage CJIE4-3]AHN83001.1 hypothetical protein 00-6200_00026 [Campylobacter phage CJIE4-4]EAJ2198509.1 hypothetical protein [Campylobacter hyointestinalis]AAW35888.1 hypothetical protein CJE1445 [Campylobacter jejuni RM1221]